MCSASRRRCGARTPTRVSSLRRKSLRAGGYWLPELAKEIAEATAFVLLVGENGLGPWQVTEYYEALDRRVKEPDFPVVLVLLEGQPAPGLPFLRQLHWIVTAGSGVARRRRAADGCDRRRRHAGRASCGATPRPIAALPR